MSIGRIAETVRDQLPEWANTEPEIVAHHFTSGRPSGTRHGMVG